MSKEWDSLSSEEQKETLAKLGEVYKEAGFPAWLKQPKAVLQFVNVLKAGQQMKQHMVVIEGSCGPDQKDVAADLSKKIKTALGDVKAQVDIKGAYSVGDKMGKIVGVNDVMKGSKTTVEHEAGQVILLDFWATWCPPCQEPMAHNQKMLEKRGAEWGDKVRILGLSIDSGAEEVKKHVEADSRKWTSVEHYHVKTDGCVADEEYGVSGVPHVLLVDKEGTIVFCGHPANRTDLEADFDALLKGEKLTGEGCEVPASESGDAVFEGKEIPDDEAATMHLKFSEDVKGIMAKDEFKEIAEKCPRLFCVLVDEISFDLKSGKSYHDMTCHTQLFGPQAEIDKLKAIVDTINKNDAWVNKDMLRAT